jgi:zinc protease
VTGTVVLAAGLLAASPGAAQDSARWKAWPGSRPPKPLPARDMKFPPYEIRTLGNGLRVIAVSQHEQPAVTLRLLVRAGAAQDPKGKSGLAALAGALLDQGTTSRSAEQIAGTIDNVGGALGTGAGTDLSFISVIVMKDSFDLALDLLSDVARNPAFSDEEIARQREQILSAMKVSAEDPGFVAGAVIDRLVFGFHPYGLPGNGTPESVAGLTREDLVQFHRDWFVPNNAILAIVGDLSPEEAFAGAERVLGPWARRDVPILAFPEPPPATRRVVVVDKPGAVQTEIRIGNVAVPRKHPDYLALDLAVRILGGEGSNRLQRVLRSERGLTYGASAELEALKHAGGIVAETDTRSQATGEVLRISVDEIWKPIREPVGDWELSNAKAYITGNYPLTLETPNAIAAEVLETIFFDLDLKELETFRDRVNAISVDDIQRVSRLYLRPGRLSIALVGDASAVGPQLRAVGFEDFEVVPIDQLDLSAVNFRRGSSQASNRRP